MQLLSESSTTTKGLYSLQWSMIRICVQRETGTVFYKTITWSQLRVSHVEFYWLFYFRSQLRASFGWSSSRSVFRLLLLFCSHSESRVRRSSPSCQLTADTSCYYELQIAQEQLLQQTLQLTQSAQKGTCRQFFMLRNKCWNLTYL